MPPTSSIVCVACLAMLFQPATAEERFDALLRQGFELHQKRLYFQAIEPLERAHRLRPDEYYVNLLLGIDHLRSGSAEKALPFLDAASKANPTDATALGYATEAHSVLGRLDLAVRALHAAKRRDPSPSWRAKLVRFYLVRFRRVAEELRRTRLGLARSYLLQAHATADQSSARQRDALLRAYSLAPDLTDVSTALAHAEIRHGRFQLARQILRDTHTRLGDPRNLELAAAEAYLAAHYEDWPVALAMLRELGSRSPKRMQVAIEEWPLTIHLPEAMRQSLEQMSSSNPSGAHPSYSPRQLFKSQHWEAVTTRISASDATPEQLLWLGTAHARLGNFEAAVGPLEKVRTVSRYQGEAHYWLASSYVRLIEGETAALRRDPAALPILHAVRGEIELRLAGNAVAAARHYEKALALTPGDPALWTGLAAAELSAGEWENSRRSALKALELDPERGLASRTFAEACMQERDYEAAIPALEKVLRLEPDDIGAKFLLGTAYSQVGKSKKALMLLQAVEDSDFPDEKGRLQYLLGTVLRKLGLLGEAQIAFQRSQELADAFARTSHSLASPAEDLPRD